MTVRNLEHALAPRSIAIIGASNTRGSVGKVLTENVLAGGFAGEVYLVNPRHKTIGARRCYPDVVSLPEAPELAVIATKPDTVPALVEALGTTAIKARLQALGIEPMPSTPAELATYARSERERWGRVIRAAGIRLD